MTTPKPSSKPTILVVEDDRIIQHLFKFWLSGQLKYPTLITDNEEQTLEFFPSCQLVLMDFQLPKTTGVLLTKLIRNHEKGKNIPIIGVSAMSDIRETCLEAGMNDFMQKPVDFGLLQQKIERWLEV